MDIWNKSILGKGNSQCKGPEAGPCLAHWRPGMDSYFGHSPAVSMGTWLLLSEPPFPPCESQSHRTVVWTLRGYTYRQCQHSGEPSEVSWQGVSISCPLVTFEAGPFSFPTCMQATHRLSLEPYSLWSCPAGHLGPRTSSSGVEGGQQPARFALPLPRALPVAAAGRTVPQSAAIIANTFSTCSCWTLS